MSVGCLRSLCSLGLHSRFTMNSASVCVSLRLAGHGTQFCSSSSFAGGVFFCKPSPSAIPWQHFGWSFFLVGLCVCYAIPEYAASMLLAALVIWVLLPAEKLWDSCPHSPAMFWDKHRRWSRGGCRCFCCYVIFLYKKKLHSLSFTSITCIFFLG